MTTTVPLPLLTPVLVVIGQSAEGATWPLPPPPPWLSAELAPLYPALPVFLVGQVCDLSEEYLRGLTRPPLTKTG